MNNMARFSNRAIISFLYANFNEFLLLDHRLDMQYSLLDYVNGGCKIKFMTAIDFTVSAFHQYQ